MNDVAIVTGAAQGLGRHIVEALHAAGYRVAATDVQVEAVEELARSLDPSGETAIGLGLDVTSKAAFEAARDALVAKWGRVDVAVSNAAMTPATPVMQIQAEEFDRVLAVNLRGTLFLGQVFGEAMAKAGYGRLVFLASLAGQNGGTAAGAHYASSKAGIMTLVKIFARDLGPSGVTCNAIAPGPLDLPIVHKVMSPERLAQVIATIPARRLGDPSFVAETVVHLASRQAGAVTGATWDMNGGIFMR